ncbi:MAG TPA: hypothetical protein V6D07_18875 [Trichocoleus sp.]
MNSMRARVLFLLNWLVISISAVAIANFLLSAFVSAEKKQDTAIARQLVIPVALGALAIWPSFLFTVRILDGEDNDSSAGHDEKGDSPKSPSAHFPNEPDQPLLQHPSPQHPLTQAQLSQLRLEAFDQCFGDLSPTEQLLSATAFQLTTQPGVPVNEVLREANRLISNRRGTSDENPTPTTPLAAIAPPHEEVQQFVQTPQPASPQPQTQVIPAGFDGGLDKDLWSENGSCPDFEALSGNGDEEDFLGIRMR